MNGLSDALAQVEDAIAGILLAIVLGIVTYELTIRGLFGHSNLWTDELSRVILIAMVYFAAIGVTREGSHVRVELLVDLAPPGLRSALEKLSDLACLAFSLCATWYGIAYVRESMRFGISFVHSYLPFPLWVAQLVVPISFALISFRLILRLLGLARPASGQILEV
jgi:TRAP-type C4-dicarboxylate transport system permease small subunit